MNKRILPPLVAAAALLVISFAGNPPIDSTGGPFSGGSYCGNSSCHGGSGSGDFGPSLSVQLLTGEDEITEYQPGATYRFRVTVNTSSGNPVGYGFMAVALLDADSSQAGTFTDLSDEDDVQIRPAGGRQYASQNKRSNTNVFELDWTAPEAGSGPVEFWVAGNAVNGNGASSGDSPVRLETPFTVAEGAVTSLRQIASLESWSVFPNPVSYGPLRVQLRAREQDRLQLSIWDGTGRRLITQAWEVQAGTNTRNLDLTSLPAGNYWVQLSNADGRRTGKAILKR